MDTTTKIVEFGQYCPTCRNFEKEEDEDPCCDCLNIEVRDNSHKPEYWVEKENTK